MSVKEKCMCGNKKCDSKVAPGNTGMFSDKSLKFYEDPLTFIQAQTETYNTRVFMARLALKPTLVIADHALVAHFLESCSADFHNGLRDNFSELFGDSILFADEEKALQLREVLMPLFDQKYFSNSSENLKILLEDWYSDLDLSNEINFYEEFKNLALIYNLEVFLGLNHKDDLELMRDYMSSSKEHWHGVLSLPFHISLPVWGNTGYSRAMDAKGRLQTIIRERLRTNSSAFVDQLNDNNNIMQEESVCDHLLLFTCALIPKAVGAILSVVLEVSWYWTPLLDAAGNIHNDHLEHMLLEVTRLYPPFIGGIRVADVDTRVGEYHVRKGTTVHFSLLGCMRDPARFPDPDTFRPERWSKKADPLLGREDMLGFGSGAHACVGRSFSWEIIKEMTRFTMKTFSLNPTLPDSFPKVKFLPCLRPLTPTLFKPSPRINPSNQTKE